MTIILIAIFFLVGIFIGFKISEAKYGYMVETGEILYKAGDTWCGHPDALNEIRNQWLGTMGRQK
jgi:hypothetical protein